MTEPVLETRSISKNFLGKQAVHDVSLSLSRGEVLCVLGHNGAGKSTLIKVLSGVMQPSSGYLSLNGKKVTLRSPQDARQMGISTVHQDVGTIPLMSVARNFFLGVEPSRRIGPFKFLDLKTANDIAIREIAKVGIRGVEDGKQAVGTLSGGERQGLAIARAIYFGANVLILDEPTSDLGVREAAIVLSLVQEIRSRGVAVILITHNARHALAVGDKFAVLVHGALADSFKKGQRSTEEVINLMAGGSEMEELERDREEADEE